MVIAQNRRKRYLKAISWNYFQYINILGNDEFILIASLTFITILFASSGFSEVAASIQSLYLQPSLGESALIYRMDTWRRWGPEVSRDSQQPHKTRILCHFHPSPPQGLITSETLSGQNSAQNLKPPSAPNGSVLSVYHLNKPVESRHFPFLVISDDSETYTHSPLRRGCFCQELHSSAYSSVKPLCRFY